MEYPKHLKFTKEHEWLLVEGDVGTVGITQHAQEALGDIVFVELPEVGASLEKDEEFGTVESTKTVSELFAAVSGEVTEVNEALEDKPELLNTDPHEEGWMIKFTISDPSELETLMSADEYQAFLEQED